MRKLNNSPRRYVAGALAALLLATAATPVALAAEAAETDEFTPACDETYYATLDEYGKLVEASVVKSYKTYGNSSITDYGTYDEINNLTNSEEAVVSGDTVTFNVPEGTNRFYFEGKTTKPFEELPWTLTVSYKLNGVPTKAEDLAGKTGTVDITLDAVPNETASEYSSTNLVLIAASMFNGDDILSLEADGAQVQLLGNIYCVLYAVLPGEEDHFTFSVGSDDFTYDGMIFLAVPATLEQLDKISELRDAKDKVEDSYNAISDSLDVILNSVDGLGENMRKTAEGLDELNQGRQVLEDGMPDVYKKLDNALEDVDDLGATVTPLEKHISNAGTAFTATSKILSDMNEDLKEVSEKLPTISDVLTDIRRNLNEMKTLIDAGEEDDGTAKAALNTDLATLKNMLSALQGEFKTLEGSIDNAKTELKDVEGTTEVTVDLLGTGNALTVSQIESLIKLTEETYAACEDKTTFVSDLANALEKAQLAKDKATAQTMAAKLAEFFTKYTTNDEYKKTCDEKLKAAKDLNSQLHALDTDVEGLKTLLDDVDIAADEVLPQVEALCESMSTLTGRLESLCDPTAGLLGDLEGVVTAAGASLSTCSSDLNKLAALMNQSLPEVKSTIEDAEEFTDTASDTLDSLARAGKVALRVIRAADDYLNDGTQDTLESLSDALQKAAKGFDQTSTIRNAKNVLTSLIEDEWDEHTGEADNLLLIDGDAECVSMTDSRNTGTASIQYVMRTAEIKHTDDTAESEDAAAADNGTFFTRVAKMFSDIWNGITGIFKKN